MMTRTNTETVTFQHPFVLDDLGETYPAGTYILETEEELLEGVSFPAYRRVSTLLHLLTQPDRPGVTKILSVDPEGLEAALLRDATFVPAATKDETPRTHFDPSDVEPPEKSATVTLPKKGFGRVISALFKKF